MSQMEHRRLHISVESPTRFELPFWVRSELAKRGRSRFLAPTASGLVVSATAMLVHDLTLMAQSKSHGLQTPPGRPSLSGACCTATDTAGARPLPARPRATRASCRPPPSRARVFGASHISIYLHTMYTTEYTSRVHGVPVL